MANFKEQEKVLQAISTILDLCYKAQVQNPAESVAKEIESIQFLRDRVSEDWPLSRDLKRDIFIGPYAARNLVDWTQHLAHFIMVLDNTLQNNGKGINELLSELSATV